MPFRDVFYIRTVGSSVCIYADIATKYVFIKINAKRMKVIAPELNKIAKWNMVNICISPSAADRFSGF